MVVGAKRWGWEWVCSARAPLACATRPRHGRGFARRLQGMGDSTWAALQHLGALAPCALPMCCQFTPIQRMGTGSTRARGEDSTRARGQYTGKGRAHGHGDTTRSPFLYPARVQPRRPYRLVPWWRAAVGMGRARASWIYRPITVPPICRRRVPCSSAPGRLWAWRISGTEVDCRVDGERAGERGQVLRGPTGGEDQGREDACPEERLLCALRRPQRRGRGLGGWGWGGCM
jgi:hypothetical protein